MGSTGMVELTQRQRQVLEFIDTEVRRRGYPPSVREIGEAVGLSSSSTVHAHLAALQEKGYLTRDPSKPRAIEVHFEPRSGAAVERRPVRFVPVVGDVAAGTGVLAAENIEESLPLPEDFTGEGQLFVLRVRGESMIEAGIFDGDYVVVRQQPDAEADRRRTAEVSQKVEKQHEQLRDKMLEAQRKEGWVQEEADAVVAAELQRAQHIASSLTNATVLPKLSIGQLAAVISRAQAGIGVDTGLSHLSAALNIPTIAIYSDTNPALTGVYAGSLAPAINLGNVGEIPYPNQVLDALRKII